MPINSRAYTFVAEPSSQSCIIKHKRGWSPTELRIVLDGLDPPTGRAYVDGRDAWTFVGWLELMQALERFGQDEAARAPASA